MIHPEPSTDVRIDINTATAYRPPSDCCIYKVQKHLREVNKVEYEPNIIAIGPYHSPFHNNKNDHLRLMEGHKERYQQDLNKRMEEKAYTSFSTDFIASATDAIKSVENEVRKCYAEPLDNYGLDELVKMMVLDACFIIELVRKSSHPELQEENDPIFRMGWIINSLKRDLLLFENQIPFFVVCMLFDITKDPGSDETFTHLARNFFTDILPGDARRDNDDSDNPKRFKHLLGLVHSSWLPLFSQKTAKEENQIGLLMRFLKGIQYMIGVLKAFLKGFLRGILYMIGFLKRILYWIGFVKPPSLNASDDGGTFAKRLDNYKYIHCVSDLKEAGIDFKKGKGNIFDIKFENGTLIIPPFIVEKRTESFFRNLIAHEQYRQGTDRHFVTDYIKFMDCLINSSRDVGSLRRRKIMNNWLGDDEVVSSMFNKMTDSVVGSGEFFHYNDVFDRVNVYYGQRRHRWMAILRRTYLNSPWAFVSILAASVLLVLTLLQTVYTMKG